MEIFRQYYKLIPVVSGGRRARGGHKDIGCFTLKACHDSHEALIMRLLDNENGWKLAWFFVADLGNYLHNWKSWVPGD